MESFAADAEFLGQIVPYCEDFDNDFRKLCIEDNQHIFALNICCNMEIPEVKPEDLNRIIDKEFKNGKSCDVYKLTPEHLKHCDQEARLYILSLLNSIITDMNYLSCPQIKAGLGTAVYKGKRKPLNQSSSYRRITVTPQLGSIIDRHVDPIAEALFKQVQNTEQYGFTKNVNYLMAAVLRGECQRWALDTGQTCYGVSFDGKAAFPSVDRDIQIRELYACGEKGNLLEYSRRTYDNTLCRMKDGQLLSREFQEHRGSRQGHKRAAGHFKTYINPCLQAANSSSLGFYIGTICVCSICVADDTYIVSNDPRRLQGLINIVGHFGRRYWLQFGADKTKVTVTGSNIDMDYYQDIGLWTLYGQRLTVTEDNEHLGLLVSGTDEVTKNIDKNIKSTRGMLFKFLGNIFAFRCKLSPMVQYHAWQVYVKPVLRSGLSALPIRSSSIKPLKSFHHKVLRAILKLSSKSPIAPLYFLLGELPIEATLHLDMLALFWNIWVNPQTQVFQVLEYLLKVAGANSRTWAAHLRTIFLLYELPDPLELLSHHPWTKERWKNHVKAAVMKYHESTLRQKSVSNSKLRFLNIQARGLCGKVHPLLSWVMTSHDVDIVRPHLKMLAGDYACYASLAHDNQSEPYCRLCLAQISPTQPPQIEDLVHVLVTCNATNDTRSRVMPDLLNVICDHFPKNMILNMPPHATVAQFIIDCSSLNLNNSTRVNHDHPAFTMITRQCSTYVYAIHSERIRQLKVLGYAKQS